MKNALCYALLCLCFPFISFAQIPFLDPSFGQDGVVITDLNGITNYCSFEHVALQSDGKIIAVGSASINVASWAVAARFNSDGSLDNTFGTNGVWVSTDPNFVIAIEVLVQPDDKILITGWGGGNAKTVRLLPNGVYDTSFGQGGKSNVVIWPGGITIMIDMALQTDGKILVSGYKSPESAVIRLKPNGKVDSTFGTFGKVIIHNNFFNPPADHNYGLKIGSNADNSVLVSGVYYDGINSYPGFVARFDNHGVLDTAYGTNNGYSLFYRTEQQVLDLFELPSGECLVLSDLRASATAKSRTNLIKWKANGQLDSSFANNGFAALPFGAGGTYSRSGYMQPDGKVLVFGINFYGGAYRQSMSRFNVDGSVDTTLGQAGIIESIPPVSFKDGCVQSDGKIISVSTYVDSSGHEFGLLTRFLASNMVGAPEILTDLHQVNLYPNPSGNGRIQLEYYLNEPSSVRVELMDLQGRLVSSLSDAELPAGKVEASFALPVGLNSGWYLVSVQTSKGSSLLKLLVQ